MRIESEAKRCTYSLERKLAGRVLRIVRQHTIVGEQVKQLFNVEAMLHRARENVAQKFPTIDFVFLGQLGG